MSSLNEYQLNQVMTASGSKLRDEAELNKAKQAIQQIVDDSWSEIHTVRPLLAFGVGLLMIVGIFIAELIFDKKDDSGRYLFIFTLACATSAGAFAAGFTGAMNLKTKWLQATGGMAVFALVFFGNPLNTEKKESPAPAAATAQPEKLGILSFVGISDASAQPPNTTPATVPQTATTNTIRVSYIRVYYPRGVSDLNQVAFRVSNSMAGISERSEVFSLGSVFSAPINSLRYSKDKYQIAIAHRPGLEQSVINNVVSQLGRMRMTVDAEDIESRFTDADISIYVRIL